MKKIIIACIIGIISLFLFFLVVKGDYGNAIFNQLNGRITAAGGPFESSHERAPYALIISLFKYKSFSLTKSLADFASSDTIKAQNKFFIIFPPGISFLAFPFFVFGFKYNLAQIFTYFGMALFSVFNLVLLFLIARDVLNLRYYISIFISLIFGFACTAFSYATGLYQHQVTTFLILSSFYAAWKYKRNHLSILYGLWVWMCLGISIWIDYPDIVLLLPIIIYFFFNNLKIHTLGKVYKFSVNHIFIVTSILFFAIVISQGFYNHANFGGWSKLSQTLPRYDSSKTVTPVSTSSASINTVKNRPSPLQIIAGILQEDRLPSGIYELTVAPDKGLFLFSPIFILAIFAVPFLFSRLRKEVIVLTSIVLVNFFFYGSFDDPWGGWAFGPRYLIPSMAILSLFVGVWLTNLKRQTLGKFVALILFTISSAIALLGALTTNAVPPKVEAVYLKIKYGFLYNFDYLMRNQTGNFIYNQYVSHYLSLFNYYLIILSAIIVFVFFLLFLVPFFEKE